MAKTGFKLTEQQKREYKRLTQLANRRIRAFTKEYEKAGLEIIPHEVSGGIQVKEQWHTPKTPVSRSIKFTSEQEYREKRRWLKTFDSGIIRENVTDYTKTQRRKTIQAINTAMGGITDYQRNAINEMSVTELAIFWKKFSDVSKRLGMRYSSEQAMLQTTELMSEDIEGAWQRAMG